MRNPMRGKLAGYMALAMGMACMGEDVFDGNYSRHVPYDKPVKKCLQCGKEHTHNNSWCSASCCKQYRQQQKEHKGVAAKLRTTSANQNNLSITSVAPAVQPAR